MAATPSKSGVSKSNWFRKVDDLAKGEVFVYHVVLRTCEEVIWSAQMPAAI